MFEVITLLAFKVFLVTLTQFDRKDNCCLYNQSYTFYVTALNSIVMVYMTYLCALGTLKLGVKQKKRLHVIQLKQDFLRIFFRNANKECVCVCDAFLLASISAYISKVQSHFWKSGLGLELNFLGFQIEENFWESMFSVFIQKIFPQNHPCSQKSNKMTKYSFFVRND